MSSGAIAAMSAVMAAVMAIGFVKFKPTPSVDDQTAQAHLNITASTDTLRRFRAYVEDELHELDVIRKSLNQSAAKKQQLEWGAVQRLTELFLQTGAEEYISGQSRSKAAQRISNILSAHPGADADVATFCIAQSAYRILKLTSDVSSYLYDDVEVGHRGGGHYAP